MYLYFASCAKSVIKKNNSGKTTLEQKNYAIHMHENINDES